MLTYPVLLLAILSAPAADLPAAFEAHDVGRIMQLWHEASPTLVADRKRLTLLALDDVRIAVDADRLEVRDPAGTLLEQYQLAMKDDRVWSLLRPAPATPLATAREQIHRGVEHLDAGELEAAQAAFTRAAELADANGHASTRALAQRGLGSLAFTRGDSESAVRHLEAALAISRAAGDGHGEGRALIQLGHVARTMGNPFAAANFSAALQIFRDRGHRLAAAHATIGLGIMHNTGGDHKSAHLLFTDAARTLEELGDIDGLGTALNALGVTARIRGSYAESAAVLRRALELHRSTGNLAGIGNAQGNLGIALSAQGQYAEAVTAYAESLKVHERLGRVQSIMIVLGNIGEMYNHLGDSEQAREHSRRSLAMAEKSGYKPGVALMLHNLALIHFNEDDLRGAIELLEKSLAIEEELGNRDDIARTLHNLGRVYWAAGDRARARSSFEKSRAIAEELENPEQVVISLGMLAEVTESPEESLVIAQRMYAAARPTFAPQVLWSVYVGLGRAYRRTGRLAEARAELERAVAIAEELRRSVPGEEIEQQQAFASMVMPYVEMVGVLVEEGDAGGALAYAERAKARALLDVLRHGRPELAQALTDAERAREGTLSTQVAEVNREYREALVRGDVAPELLTRMRKARLDYEAFVDAVFAAHPQLRKETGELLPARATDASVLLASGAADAFVEFVVGDEQTYLFVITTGGGVRVHTVPVGKRQLRTEVLRFRELLATHDLTYAAAARSLYDRLLAPAAAQLRGKRTLCIVPDGPLWELPFQALQPSANAFLLDRHAIYFAPSLTVLRETTREPAPRGSELRLLAFGNPLVPRETANRAAGVRRDASLAPLPHAETEVRAIAALYGPGNSRVHLRGDAREEVVKAEAGRYDVLHFATHGVLDDRNALYSRLVFSPPVSATEDGLLEAREIMRLDLKARLAVLSACETARGSVGAGEGLIGLSWALFVAGVPTTVVSQWNVDSSSTAALMVDFHRNLRGSQSSVAEALRKAALATRTKPSYRHPFYWAPFVVVGNAR
ncbi:MAG TPA: CHAT domain-containing tetratricopeptide repeat protein [Thermoanaerobaculia bacterium]|jgi:CHAT domain-containing protein/Flp pilus assembly protein TadD